MITPIIPIRGIGYELECDHPGKNCTGVFMPGDDDADFRVFSPGYGVTAYPGWGRCVVRNRLEYSTTVWSNL